MDWSKQIMPDGTVKTSGCPYYHISYEMGLKEHLYGVDCSVPDPPPDEHCVNYGLSIEDQVFRKDHIPEQVRYRDRDWGRDSWSEREIESFVDQQFNRRLNGVWFWIKGKKVFVPGQLWFKYNHWTPSTGEPLEYRTHEREEFTLFLHIQRDPTDLGFCIFKPRQIGETEGALVLMYERGSRIRNSLTTMQSCINETHAEETYSRLIHGHKHMIWYFKPMNTGTENPKKGLVLDYPTKHMTHAETIRQAEKGNTINKSSLESYQYPPIGSRFNFGPSKVKHFDGRTGLLTCYLDEFGKSEAMDPVEWVQTMVPTVFSNIRGKKRGIIIMTSTIEDMSENSLDWAMTIWRESDPNKRKKTGSTTSRIVRIFRGAAEMGFENIIADRWGDIDRDAVIEAVTEQYNAMMDAGNVRGAMSFIRKYPRTIDDVFMSVRNQSGFNTVGLTQRDFHINEVVSPKPWVRGNLKWKDGQKDTEVVWEPNPNGLWEISSHPSDHGLMSNAKSVKTFSRSPGNTEYYCAGVDPVDQSKTLETDDKRSKIGIAVMRRLDLNVDSDKNLYHQKDDDVNGISAGDPIMGGELHKTNRFVATYKHRHPDVFDDFENIILTMVYFGTDFLPEDNKAGALKTYLRNRGYENYVTNKPSISANYKGQHQKGGVSGSEKTFNECFSFIETYTYKWYNAINHPMLLSDWISMNWANRGEKDLGVAAGWCLYHSHMQPKRKIRVENKKKAVHFKLNTV